MPVVTDSAKYDSGIVINGRPDFQNPDFGKTIAKSHPPYVFGVSRNCGLIHKVAYVELHWYRIAYGGHKLVRLKSPIAIATTVCHQSWWLEGLKCRTCKVPNPDAVFCGRCDGEPASFGKRGKHRGMPRPVAHVKLGCVVNGYPGG